MAVKFAYIDIDEEVYVASSKPFDMNNLEPDPEGYTKEIVEKERERKRKDKISQYKGVFYYIDLTNTYHH